MRAQRLWTPVEPDFGAARVHSALTQLAANFHLPDFRQREIEAKIRDAASVLRTELRHLLDFIREWFCLSFQI